MDVKQFLSEFRHIASASKGIQQLREMILSLAVTGDLVKSHLNEPDIISLERIGGELFHYRDRLDNNSSLKEQKKTILVFVDSFPSHWPLVRLDQIGVFIRGVSYAKSVAADEPRSDYVGLLRANNIGSEVNFNNLVYIPRNLVKDEQFLLAGDILIAMSSGSKDLVGKASRILTNIDRTFGAFCGVFRCMPSCDNRFVHMLLQSPQYRVQISKQGRGIGINNLTKRHIEEFSFCFPPLEEQRSIVAKVDELMVLCDKLEAQHQERETLCKITRTATLKALANAEDSRQLEVAWARTSDNISLLLNSEQGSLDLQYSLTKLAVRGFLANWTKESPPLDEIKEKCSSLKQEYIYNGWLRKRNPVGPTLHQNNVYPPHWGILPLDEVAVIIGGITKGHRLRGEDIRSCIYLSVANVQRGFFDLAQMKRIEVPIHQIEKYRVENGDLLIAEGGDWDKVGRTAIWAGEILDCLHQNHIFKARIPSSLLLNEWVELVLNSEAGRDYFAGASKQTTNLASINMTQLRSFPLPIPPIAEQIAILQKVNHLLSICQELEQQRIELYDVARTLVSAAISSITGIQIEDKEKMKVPKTELVCTLRINVSPANSERAPLAALLIRNNGEIPAKTLWQASELEIDAFYQQLKAEMAKGWIVQEVAHMKEVEAS